MATNKKPAKAVKKRSVDQLVGVIATKDQALSDKDDQIASLKLKLEDAQDVKASPSTLDGLEGAVNVLRDNGFTVFTEVKIEDCKEEDGQRARSFRRSGRYDVAIVGTRTQRF